MYRNLDSSTNAKTYLYAVPSDTTFNGAKASSSTRSFISEKGCEIGIGFKFENWNKTRQFIDLIKGKYSKIGENINFGSTNLIIYLESEDIFASLVLYNVTERKETSAISYSASLKSCGKEAAYGWQTLPR